MFAAVMILALCHAGTSPVSAQNLAKGAAARPQADARSSAAYAEILLKKVQAQTQLEALAAEYTDDYPKVTELRFTLETAERELARLMAVKPADSARLSLALGKLMAGKIDAETELWVLRKTLQDAHPDVKRAKRKVDIYEAAIKEILG